MYHVIQYSHCWFCIYAHIISDCIVVSVQLFIEQFDLGVWREAICMSIQNMFSPILFLDAFAGSPGLFKVKACVRFLLSATASINVYWKQSKCIELTHRGACWEYCWNTRPDHNQLLNKLIELVWLATCLFRSGWVWISFHVLCQLSYTSTLGANMLETCEPTRQPFDSGCF